MRAHWSDYAAGWDRNTCVDHGPFLEEPTFQGQRQAPNAITEQHSEVRANKGEQIVFLET